MKLAFSTLGCPDWSFEKILNEAQRMGYTGIEIRGIDGEMRAEKIPQFFPEHAEQTKAALKVKGLTLVGFGTSVSFHDDENYESALEEGRQAIDVCALMDIPAIRVFGDRAIPDEAAAIEKIAKGLRTLCEYARGKKVAVMLEIHGDFNRLEVVMPIIEKVKNCPEFAILWDIAHSDRTYGDNWQVFYEGIKPWIRHIHVKDHARNNGA
ncbi:MAG: sugar phosphate isomerase/epimerase, partial [Defluviitaleaceae bacterium]|nr:sugar phosphate isomerase/epimerase [Defluviitaleaceae bacterium]